MSEVARAGSAGRSFRSTNAYGVLVYFRTMLIFVAIWFVGAMLISNRLLLPSPTIVFSALFEAARDGDLAFHALTSLLRLIVAMLAAAVIGLPLGFAIGLSRTWEDVFELPIELLRPIAGIAWIPLALFMFGIGNTLPVFIMFYTALFPLIIGTAAGVRSTDKRLLAAARTMGVTGMPLVLRVVLPSALPSIIISLRLAVAAAWTAVVAAELVGAPSGLGYAIEYFRSMLATNYVIAFIAVIGVLGFVTDKLLRFAETRLAPWSRDRVST